MSVEKNNKFNINLSLLPGRNSPKIKIIQEQDEEKVEQDVTKKLPFNKLNLQQVSKENTNSNPDSERSLHEPESPGSKSERSPREGETYDVSKLKLNLPKKESFQMEKTESDSSDSSSRQSSTKSSLDLGLKLPLKNEDNEEEKREKPKLTLNLNFKKEPTLSTSPDKSSEREIDIKPAVLPALRLNNLKQPIFGQEIDSPQASSESDRTDPEKKITLSSPTIPINQGKRIPTLQSPFSIKIPQKELNDSPLSSESDRPRAQTTSEKRKRKVRLDLLLGDFCTEFEVEGRVSKDDLKLNLDTTLFGDERTDLNFEFYAIKGFNEPNSPVEHYGCKPLNQDFNVKLLKQLMYENKALKVKLEKSTKTIETLQDEKKILQQQLNKEKRKSNTKEEGDEVENLKQKVEVYEKLRQEVVKQLEYLKSQQQLLEE